MPSATASGADKDGGSSARSREHSQGNQGRSFTVEQEAAVIRIRRCNATAFYDILGLESVKTSCSDSEIKKAYRKLSLLTHPDKNGHPKADEAFKMVSRAFGILGDKEKREKFDKFGGDPDSRFSAAQAQNPFSGFANRQASGGRPGGMGGNMFQEEMTPEEMFARFFGGAGGGPFGGGQFGGGTEFFSFGGGPGIRVHQFGGPRPRRRPREGQEQEQNPGLQNLIGLLPIILFFIIPMLTNLFSGGSSNATPNMRFDNPVPPYTHGRSTPNLGVQYFVKEADIDGYTRKHLDQLDKTAEVHFVNDLRRSCEGEKRRRRQHQEDAQGWFFADEEKMAKANALPRPSCDRLRSFGLDHY